MALQPADTPPAKTKLTPLFQEVLDDGEHNTWYIVKEYSNWGTARGAADNARRKFPDLEITASRGKIFARRTR